MKISLIIGEALVCQRKPVGKLKHVCADEPFSQPLTKPALPLRGIVAVSIVNRFLKHSRILYFHHGGDEFACNSSAGRMPRNLDRRIGFVPIEDEEIRRPLIDIMKCYNRDNVKSCGHLSMGAFIEPDRFRRDHGTGTNKISIGVPAVPPRGLSAFAPDELRQAAAPTARGQESVQRQLSQRTQAESGSALFLSLATRDLGNLQFRQETQLW